MPAQELAQIQTMLIAVRCHGIGERGEAVRGRKPSCRNLCGTYDGDGEPCRLAKI